MSYLENFKNVNRLSRINRTVQIILSISLITTLNVLATRHFSRTDLTRRNLYSLSPETIAYIRQIEEPVKIIVTIPANSEVPFLEFAYGYVKDLATEYVYAARDGDEQKITLEFVDIYKEIKKADAIAHTYGLNTPDAILVTSAKKQRVLGPQDMFQFRDGQPYAFFGEQSLTSAILEVSDLESDKIYFLVGHGEMRLDDVDPRRGLSQWSQVLQQRNFVLANLDLTQADRVPGDADLVVIPSPQGPLMAHEVEKLRIFLANQSGRLIVLIDPWRRHGLEDLFFEWGILADDMQVFDTGKDYQGASGDLLIRRFTAEHPITDNLLRNQIPVVVGLARPVRRDLGSPLDERLSIQELMASSDQSWAEQAYREAKKTSDLTFNPETDLPGPVAIAAVSERKVSSQLGIRVSGGRLVVFGNSDMISNQRITSVGNHMIILNTVNWCLDRDKMLTIPPRPLERFQILLSKQEINQLGLVLFTLPAIVALMGVVVHWFRRH